MNNNNNNKNKNKNNANEALETIDASELEVANGGRYRPVVQRWWNRLRDAARTHGTTPPIVPGPRY
jgi:hypothetical protein